MHEIKTHRQRLRKHRASGPAFLAKSPSSAARWFEHTIGALCYGVSDSSTLCYGCMQSHATCVVVDNSHGVHERDTINRGADNVAWRIKIVIGAEWMKK